MIKGQVQSGMSEGFFIQADEPVRVEISSSGVITVYRGFEVDMEQEPDACFDTASMDIHENKDWVLD